MSDSTINIAMIVIGALLIALFGFSLFNPITEATGQLIEFNYEESSEVLRLCKDFEGDLFLKLTFFESGKENHYKRFRDSGLFFTGEEDVYFRKVKLFCGAIIPIFESIDYGRNTQNVIYQINQTYGKYYNFELDGDEILGIVEDSRDVKDSWSHQITNLLVDEVEGIA